MSPCVALKVVMATSLLSSTELVFENNSEAQSLDENYPVNMKPEYLEPTLNLILALVIIFLHGIALIILINILLRPSLWTAFNIVGLIYLCLTIILGSYKLAQISVLVSTFLKLEDTDGINLKLIDRTFYTKACPDLASVLVIESDLRLSCTGLVYWSGTFTAREGILTSLVFTRSGTSWSWIILLY